MPIRMTYNKLRNQCGNAVLVGVVAVTLVATSAVMLTQGYLSTLKFKSRVQLKASLTSVEDGIIFAFANRALYLTSGSIARALQSQITVPQAGVVTDYNATSAAKLGSEPILNNARANCARGIREPSNAGSPAEFIFCFSTLNTSNSSLGAISSNSFFGVSSAFGLVKVAFKNRNASHLNSIIKTASWGEFQQNPESFQAEFNYQFFWGKENESAFTKTGSTIRELN